MYSDRLGLICKYKSHIEPQCRGPGIGGALDQERVRYGENRGDTTYLYVPLLFQQYGQKDLVIEFYAYRTEYALISANSVGDCPAKRSDCQLPRSFSGVSVQYGRRSNKRSTQKLRYQSEINGCRAADSRVSHTERGFIRSVSCLSARLLRKMMVELQRTEDGVGVHVMLHQLQQNKQQNRLNFILCRRVRDPKLPGSRRAGHFEAFGPLAIEAQ